MTYPLWNRRFSVVLAALLVAGCGPKLIQSDPATFKIPPEAAAQLRGQKSVTLNNAYEKETLVMIFTSSVGGGWQGDLRQYTETAITLLGGEMTGKGIDLSPRAAKSVTLRVRDVRAGFIPIPLVPRYDCSLVLEAQYEDGTKSVIATENDSPVDIPRVVSGAIMRAVERLLSDEKFLAYVNR